MSLNPTSRIQLVVSAFSFFFVNDFQRQESLEGGK